MWLGHLQRMGENRWPKRIWQWAPEGRRTRGRPKIKWNLGIQEGRNGSKRTEINDCNDANGCNDERNVEDSEQEERNG